MLTLAADVSHVVKKKYKGQLPGQTYFCEEEGGS